MPHETHVETKPRIRSRRHFLYQTSIATCACLLPSITLSKQTVQDKVAKPSGRLYFTAFQLRGQDTQLGGLFSYDLETSTWQKIGNMRIAPSDLSPDGRWVTSPKQKVDGESDGMWLIDLSGECKERMLRRGYFYSCWAPDSRSLIASHPAEEEIDKFEPPFNSWRYELDGERKEKLATNNTEMVLDWSRDGRRLLVGKPIYSRSEYRWALTTCDVSGDHRIPVAPLGINSRFTPTGDVSFGKPPVEGSLIYELWLSPKQGGEPKRLLSALEGPVAPYFYAWSADGKWLAVDLLDLKPNDEGAQIDDGRHIELMRPDGTDRRPIQLPHQDPIPIAWHTAK